MINLILCGGSGTRLWPISRTLMPKQFIKLFDDRSLFQMTLNRNRPLCRKTFIVSNMEHYFLALDQIEELQGENGHFSADFLLEPVGRNTAPAIALACMALDRDDIVLVTPSDHLIEEDEAYRQALEHAKTLAEQDYLVTFGIQPLYPETGFGYIESNDRQSDTIIGLDVLKFHEKPDLKTAESYLQKNARDSHRYFWNSGMFCFKVGTYLDELRQYAPDIHRACESAFKTVKTKNRLIRIDVDSMQEIPDRSIDYAVMEKSDRVKVVPCMFDWSDLGSFEALHEVLPKDEAGNTQNARHIGIDSSNNLLLSNRTIATIDVQDLMIVDTDDAVLVAKKGSGQKVKEIVAKLKALKSDLHEAHRTVHRPWGSFTILEDTPGYKIKRIVVKPGKRLSLQRHLHRNEHWIVVSGTATVTVGDRIFYLRPNESTYIKMGEVHRLANDGKIPVVLIEAQVGEYTKEDDIVRLDDDFSRE